MIWSSFFNKKNIGGRKKKEIKRSISKKDPSKISRLTLKSMITIFGILLAKGCIAVVIFHFLGGNVFLEGLPDLPTILDNMMKDRSECQRRSSKTLSVFHNDIQRILMETSLEHDDYLTIEDC
jgi:hypothetical protein